MIESGATVDPLFSTRYISASRHFLITRHLKKIYSGVVEICLVTVETKNAKPFPNDLILILIEVKRERLVVI